MRALCTALEDAREARGLSWTALVAEMNAPFKFVPSIPTSLSTIRGMGGRASVTSAVVVQVLRWLGRSPESFLKGRPPPTGVDASAEALPDVGPQRILRFDTKRIHAALEEGGASGGLPGDGRGRAAGIQGGHAHESCDRAGNRVSARHADHAMARAAGCGVHARLRLVATPYYSRDRWSTTSSPSQARAKGDEELVQLVERLGHPILAPEARAASRASFEG